MFWEWGGATILCYSQSGNDPWKDLAKLGYKLNMKVIFKKHSSIFFAMYLTMYKNLI
jgi:hypothetical protein